MDIRISHLTKTYDNHSRVIFQDMTARFEAGSLTVVLGKSGKGKSSLLNLIAGIDTPDRGDIFIGETRVSDLDDGARAKFRRRHVGFVFQSFNLIPVLSVLENVTLVSRLDGLPFERAREKGLSLLRSMGLENRHQDFPDRLSGGEQQRVALARALASDPEIILADEPTGNLDSKTGTLVMDLMAEQVREQGKTLVMVTHDREALAYADQVFKVENHLLVPGKN